MHESKVKTGITVVIVVMALAILTGCAGTGRHGDVQVGDLQKQLQERQVQVSALESTVEQQDVRLSLLEGEVMSANEAREKAYAQMARVQDRDIGVGDLFPPAKPGECYTRVFVPAQYEKVAEEQLRKEATETVKAVPATYEWVEEKVTVQEASSRLEEVPAEYKWIEEKVQVKEAHTVWKKGRGPIEKTDDSTGEIMCLVEVPAEFETVRKRVQVRPAATRTVQIPAQYETVKVRKMMSPPRENRNSIPAEYQTVTKWAKTSDGQMQWREVLCETNMSNGLVSRIQSALQASGHDPGPIDGVIGARTSAAVQSYQKSRSLPVGGLTHETINTLGVNVSS